MKTKAKLILKTLADLPVNTMMMAASIPIRAIEMTKRVLVPPGRATRRQIRAARQHSAKFIEDLSARANAPFKLSNSWMSGGLND